MEIGRSTATALARKRLLRRFAGDDIEDVAQLETELRNQGYQALAIKADISLQYEMTAAVDQLIEFLRAARCRRRKRQHQ